MGHLGLTPQSVHAMGGFKVQGKQTEAARAGAGRQAARGGRVLRHRARGVPDQVAAMVTEAVHVPTIGIGAGPGCDGQVLVFHDLLGPRGPRGAEVRAPLRLAAGRRRRRHRRLRRRRASGAFPSDAETYHLTDDVAEELGLAYVAEAELRRRVRGAGWPHALPRRSGSACQGAAPAPSRPPSRCTCHGVWRRGWGSDDEPVRRWVLVVASCWPRRVTGAGASCDASLGEGTRRPATSFGSHRRRHWPRRRRPTSTAREPDRVEPRPADGVPVIAVPADRTADGAPGLRRGRRRGAAGRRRGRVVVPCCSPRRRPRPSAASWRSPIPTRRLRRDAVPVRGRPGRRLLHAEHRPAAEHRLPRRDGDVVTITRMEPCEDVDGCPSYPPGRLRRTIEVPGGGRRRRRPRHRARRGRQRHRPHLHRLTRDTPSVGSCHGRFGPALGAR